MDALLASSGLSSECLLNYGAQQLAECPNCIYDAALNKSSNIYKMGGPISFTTGQICPYCRGAGLHGENKSETIYLAILWDYKSWIIKPDNLENPQGYIQTICNQTYTSNILKTQDMTVVSVQPNPPTFTLHAEPTPAGLGDQNYIICQWQKIRK
jgi:hypothetical protein